MIWNGHQFSGRDFWVASLLQSLRRYSKRMEGLNWDWELGVCYNSVILSMHAFRRIVLGIVIEGYFWDTAFGHFWDNKAREVS